MKTYTIYILFIAVLVFESSLFSQVVANQSPVPDDSLMPSGFVIPRSQDTVFGGGAAYFPELLAIREMGPFLRRWVTAMTGKNLYCVAVVPCWAQVAEKSSPVELSAIVRATFAQLQPDYGGPIIVEAGLNPNIELAKWEKEVLGPNTTTLSPMVLIRLASSFDQDYIEKRAGISLDAVVQELKFPIDIRTSRDRSWSASLALVECSVVDVEEHLTETASAQSSGVLVRKDKEAGLSFRIRGVGFGFKSEARVQPTKAVAFQRLAIQASAVALFRQLAFPYHYFLPDTAPDPFVAKRLESKLASMPVERRVIISELLDEVRSGHLQVTHSKEDSRSITNKLYPEGTPIGSVPSDADAAVTFVGFPAADQERLLRLVDGAPGVRHAHLFGHQGVNWALRGSIDMDRLKQYFVTKIPKRMGKNVTLFAHNPQFLVVCWNGAMY